LVAAILGDSIGDFATLGGTSWPGPGLGPGSEKGSLPWKTDPAEAGDVNRQHFTEYVIKPLLYGVTTLADAKDENIPAPANPQGKTKLDIAAQYNLDPLVWLVHNKDNWADKARIYAYAFSVDDTYGNLYLPGYQNMEVTVGGTLGLNNPKHYGEK